MKLKQLLALLLACLMVSSIMSSVPASAATKTPTVGQVIQRLTGVYITNSRLKERTTIIGFTKITEHKRGTFYVANFETRKLCVAGSPCPNAALRSYSSLSPDGTVSYKLVGTKGHVLNSGSYKANATYKPMFSLNPFDWPWSDLWQWVKVKAAAFWNHVVLGCLKGIKSTIVELASARVAAGSLVKRGWISANSFDTAVTKDNALIAIGSACLVGINSSFD